VEQIHAKVRERDQTKGLDLDSPMVARCPKCSAQTSGGKFCPECGATLRPRDACGQCGAKMAAGAKFSGVRRQARLRPGGRQPRRRPRGTNRSQAPDGLSRVALAAAGNR
jgi:hypothetical protein